MQHISWFLKLCLPGTIILATSLSPSHGGPPMAPMAPPTGKIQIVKTSDLAMSAIFADKCECENLLKKVDALYVKKITVRFTNLSGSTTNGTVTVKYHDWRYGKYTKTVPFSLLKPGETKEITGFTGGAALINPIQGIRAEVKAIGTKETRTANNVMTARGSAPCHPAIR